MTDWLLRAKHWQLFVVGYAVPLALSFVLYAVTFGRHFYDLLPQPGAPPPPPDAIAAQMEGMFASLALALIPMVILAVAQMLYPAAVEERFGPLAPTRLRPRRWLFRGALVAYPLCFVLYFVAFYTIFSSTPVFAVTPEADEGAFIASFLLGMGASLLAYLGMLGAGIYLAIATARLIVGAEDLPLASGNDVPVTVICLIFWPIGIWFLQPRVNALFARSEALARVPPLPRA